MKSTLTRLAAAAGLTAIAAAAFADEPKAHNFTNESLAVAVDAYEQQLIALGAARAYKEYNALYDKTWADGSQSCSVITYVYPTLGRQGQVPEQCMSKAESMAYNVYEETNLHSESAAIHSVAINGDKAVTMAFFSAVFYTEEGGPVEAQNQCRYDIALAGDTFQIQGAQCQGMFFHMNPPQQPPVARP